MLTRRATAAASRGRPCVAICQSVRRASESAQIERVTAQLSKPRLLEEQANLEQRVALLREACAPIDQKIEAADRRALSLVRATALGTLGFLTAQFAVLFNWVFFVFDWNLVEPVTYFLGYTCTWFGVVFYAKTGIEWSYDSTRDFMQKQQRERILAKQNVDLKAHSTRLAELAALENRLAAMRITRD
jgi:hypothetical protein